MSSARVRGSAAVAFVAVVGNLLACAGCGGETNAVLELQLELPTASAERSHALIQARRADGHPFDEPWPVAEDDPDAELSASGRTYHLSLVTREVEGDVHVRLRYCRERTCTHTDDATGVAPEVRITLERPFFVGERSHHTIEALPGPSEIDSVHVLRVGKCEIRACSEPTSTGYCRVDGTHFCE